MWGGGGTWEAGEDGGDLTPLYVWRAGRGAFILHLFTSLLQLCEISVVGFHFPDDDCEAQSD